MVYQFEIIGTLFGLLMIYLTYFQFRRKTIGKLALTSWTIFWILGILLVIFHSIINNVISPLNIIRVLDLYMILAFIFLFAVIFYLYVRVNKTNKRLEELARIVTLKKVKGK